jgi:hypothetical protein
MNELQSSSRERVCVWAVAEQQQRESVCVRGGEVEVEREQALVRLHPAQT